MITKSDCLVLLNDLKQRGINVDNVMSSLLKNPTIDISIIEFINNNRQLDLRSFYEKLRKSYNDKKSKLYINIVAFDKKPTEAITTLGALSLQILLFSKNVHDLQMFLRHSRFDEITKCLYNYSQTFDLTECLKLLNVIKCDLKCLEQISYKKENE